MATYGTPNYDYTRATGQLAQNKALTDAANQYGRFLSQERFRRSGEDANLQAKRKFPKVGSHFNRRGLWNSGLRREGQQNFMQDYQRDVNRLQWDQGASEAGFEMRQAQSDASYQQALLDLYERLQAQRAASYDPFAAVRGI